MKSKTKPFSKYSAFLESFRACVCFSLSLGNSELGVFPYKSLIIPNSLQGQYTTRQTISPETITTTVTSAKSSTLLTSAVNPCSSQEFSLLPEGNKTATYRSPLCTFSARSDSGSLGMPSSCSFRRSKSPALSVPITACTGCSP